MKIVTKIISLAIPLFFLGTAAASGTTYRIGIEISMPIENSQAAGLAMTRNRIVLGTHPEASESYDPQWDTPAFFLSADPSNSENPPLLKAYLAHPEYAENQRELWRDIRSDAGRGEKRWEITVSPAPSQVGKTVTVAWTLPPSLLASGERVVFSDPDLDTPIDMRSQGTYDFIADSSSPKIISISVNSPSGSSDKGSSGFFGCGTVNLAGGTPPADPPGPGMIAAVLINLLILLTPLGLRFAKFRSNRI